MENHFSKRVRISFLLPFMVLLVAPITFYFGNRLAISFTLWDAIWYVLIACLFAGFFIYALLVLSRKNLVIYVGLKSLLVGVAISVWIQSQILVWNYGPLDGRGVDWSRWKVHAIFEIVLWMFVIVAAGIIIYRGKHKATDSLINSAYAVGLVSVFISVLNSTPEKDARNKIDVFSFSNTSNVMVILFDTFQSDYLDYILKTAPDGKQIFDGFTYYRNTISGFPTTKANIPYIRTGVSYKNDIPFSDYVSETTSTIDLFKDYFDSGYHVSRAGLSQSLSFRKVLDLNSFDSIPNWASFVDYGLFKAFPTFFKAKIYNDGRWMVSSIYSKGYPSGIHGDDVRFLEAFEARAVIDKNIQKAFKFYHFATPHLPLEINSDLKHDASLAGPAGFVEQGKAALHMLNRLLDKLKDIGVYDTTEIIVLSDHGTLLMPTRRYLENRLAGVETFYLDALVRSSLAVLLHKPANTKGGMITNNAPLTLGDVRCLLKLNAKKQECSDTKEAMRGERHSRKYYYYKWSHDDWNKEFFTKITEIDLNGNAWSHESWDFGDYVYFPGKRKKLNKTLQYSVGDIIRFTADGNSDNYALLGWSYAESSHRWTDDEFANLRFQLKNYNGGDLRLDLKGSGFLPDGNLSSQHVTVYANGNSVANWNMNVYKNYTACIPSNIIDSNNILEIVFYLPDALTYSTPGRRRLGLSAVTAKILPVEECKIVISTAPAYKIGSSILFSHAKRNEQYLRHGWSHQETNHRWSNETEAALTMQIQNVKGNELMLRLDANAYLGGVLSHQDISVVVNGIQIAIWQMTGRNWYEAKIPADVVGNGLLEIVFHVNNPTAPCDVTDSKDCRKLGIAARELVIDYAKNRVKK